MDKKGQEKPPEPWRFGDINPMLEEPLHSIEEVSSTAETSSSVSSATREKRRTVEEIQSYMSSQASNLQERQEQDMMRSPISSEEDYPSEREAYRVADEALGSSSCSSSDGVAYSVNSRSTQSNTVSLVDESTSEGETDGDIPEGDVEGIDLELVEQYDHAFNEFIGAHPQFLVINPDVVHSLRVCKLQKLLERNSSIEADLQEQLNRIEMKKGRMEVAYQRELREASRKKAAREVHLASKLAAQQKASAAMEAKLLWTLVSTFEANAKKQHKRREKLRHTHIRKDRASLIKTLPQEADFQLIRDALIVPPSSEPLRHEQRMDLQQFQIDNAFLRSEVAVLTKKLKQVQADAKKNAWVESMLVRMDPKVLKALKEKYAASKGVTL